MNQRRTTRRRPLWDKSSPAITPEPRPAIGEMSREELIELVFDQKRIISAERVRHSRMENALTRYQEVLESQITDQREAFKTLGKALLPGPSDKGKK